jgi:hypothetical protein
MASKLPPDRVVAALSAKINARLSPRAAHARRWQVLADARQT